MGETLPPVHFPFHCKKTSNGSSAKFWKNISYIVLNEVQYFFKKVTIFLYEPIVHTDYVFSYKTNYLYHLIKGLLMTVFTIIVNFLSENNYSTSLHRLAKSF